MYSFVKNTPKGLLKNALGREPEITQIERDQQQVANRFQTRPTQVRTAPGRKAEPIGLHNVVDILRHRNSAGHIEVVVVPAQEEIVAEVEVLFLAMAGNRVWKPRAQPAPELPTFLPGREFGGLDAGHGQQEWRREVGPPRIAVEVGTVKQIPHRLQNVASERGPWIGALADDGTRDGFDRDPVGRESHAPVRLAERADGRAFFMKRDLYLKGIRVRCEAFHR